MNEPCGPGDGNNTQGGDLQESIQKGKGRRGVSPWGAPPRQCDQERPGFPRLTRLCSLCGVLRSEVQLFEAGKSCGKVGAREDVEEGLPEWRLQKSIGRLNLEGAELRSSV